MLGLVLGMLLMCRAGKKYRIMFRILAYEISNPSIIDVNYCVDDVLLNKSCTCLVVVRTVAQA